MLVFITIVLRQKTQFNLNNDAVCRFAMSRILGISVIDGYKMVLRKFFEAKIKTYNYNYYCTRETLTSLWLEKFNNPALDNDKEKKAKKA
jgi:hypothetical protein